jgi:hypothetical protein
MAAGAALAPEKKELQTETENVSPEQSSTLIQTIKRLFVEIFQGREEYLGWRQ